MKRAEIIVKGRVQRVGYRDTIDRLAYQHDLSGFVENLEDRTVKVVCEGEEDEIEKFIDDIRIDKYPIKVTDIEVGYSEATGEFEYFEIVREDDIIKALYESMDIAAEYLGNIFSETKNVGEEVKNVGEEVKNVGEEVKKVGEKVDGVGQKVELNIEETKKVGEKVDGVGQKVELNIEETKNVGEEVKKVGEKVDGVGQKVELNIDETKKVGEETKKVGEETKKVGEETKKVGEKVDGVGQKVELNIDETRKVGEKVERNIDETRAFREDTVDCFDRLDDKYHIVSENLVAMKQESIESRKELSRLVDHVCLLVKDHVENEEKSV